MEDHKILVDYFIAETNKKYEKIDSRLLELERLANKLIGASILASIVTSFTVQTAISVWVNIKH